MVDMAAPNTGPITTPNLKIIVNSEEKMPMTESEKKMEAPQINSFFEPSLPTTTKTPDTAAAPPAP